MKGRNFSPYFTRKYGERVQRNEIQQRIWAGWELAAKGFNHPNKGIQVTFPKLVTIMVIRSHAELHADRTLDQNTLH